MIWALLLIMFVAGVWILTVSMDEERLAPAIIGMFLLCAGVLGFFYGIGNEYGYKSVIIYQPLDVAFIEGKKEVINPSIANMICGEDENDVRVGLSYLLDKELLEKEKWIFSQKEGLFSYKENYQN